MVESYEVELVEEGRTIEVPGDTAILEAAEEQGLDLPYQCRMGVCGVCCGRRLDDADVEQTEGMFLTEGEKDEGYVLTCIARPRADLRLRTGESP
ncbi:MAG: 2Fe-2S iron-sulfur cluster-binding protein [Halobacteriales archaeon]